MADVPQGKKTAQSDPPAQPAQPDPAEVDAGSSGTRGPSKASRRIRGEIACAECRRLKIRCDRTVPCSTCVKRGCAALCPNETIPPGDGSRFVLAATDHLRKKISKLVARMHALEDAIAILCGNTSHPLLNKSLDEEDDNDDPIPRPAGEPGKSTVPDSLGSLHIDSHGGARFFGPSGGSESLLLTAKELEENPVYRDKGPIIEDLDPSYLPQEINDCCQSFPFVPPGMIPTIVQPMIEELLPPIDRAIMLCDIFFEHYSWNIYVVSRTQLVDDLIPKVYKRKDDAYGPHDLALMLIVLGIGSLVDLNTAPYNLEAQHYHKLARASLALQSVLTDQSVVTIKVLHLMSLYYGMSGKESNLEQSYAFLDFASRVALSIGFHKDPAVWGISGKEAYERRVYFWNLVGSLSWQSLITGRPPSMGKSNLQCRPPNPEEEKRYEEGQVPLGFGVWGFQASMECLFRVVDATLAVKPPSYQEILELDTRIRTYVRKPSIERRPDDTAAVSMQNFIRSHYQDLILMYLHRGFFAQGMTEHPSDPLNSPLGPSVLAAYSSACTVLEQTKSQFDEQPYLTGRFWLIWTYAFTAALIVGTVAIRGTHLKLYPPAYQKFQTACGVFRNAAETSSRAARAMPVLEVMLQKAYKARVTHSHDNAPLVSEALQDDELSYFAGRTRVVKKPDTPSPAHATIPAKPVSGEGETSETVPLEDYGTAAPFFEGGLDKDHLQSIADIPGGWDSLFHEVSLPTCQWSSGAEGVPESGVALGYGGDAMVDRWSSFMSYSNLVQQPTEGYYNKQS